MMNFSFDPTNVGATVLLVIGILVPILKRYWPKAAGVIEADAPKIKVVAEDVASFFANLAKSPMFAGIAATGKVQAHHVISQLEQTHLALAAAKAVGAFNKVLGVVVSNLSPTQKTDIIEYVRSELKQKGLMVTDTQIVEALKVAQSEYDKIEKTVMPVVVQHDQAVQAWAEPSQAASSAQQA